MYRTISNIRLKKWANEIGSLFEDYSEDTIKDNSDQILAQIKEVLINVLNDNGLNYASIYNNIDISFNEFLGIKLESNSNIPYFKYLDSGYKSFDLKPGLLNARNRRISKNGIIYTIVPIKERSGEIKFRVVSSKSRPSSWIHPGYRGRNILDKTVDRSNRLIRRELINSFSEILGGD